jgi:sugar-specific transcriptional regulator TrmB
METKYLRELGFTEGEEKVYIALLKLGSSSTGAIAKEAGVSRSKLYEILEKLTRKGVVSHYKRNNVSYFQAAHPKRILDFIEQREKALSQQKEAFEKTLPYFEEFIGQKELAKEAEVYEGMEGIRNVRELMLKSMKPGSIMYYFGNPASGHQQVLGYWDDWNRRRVKKKIWAHIIYNQDAKEFGKRREKMYYTKVKYLPKPGPSHAWIEIYGDTVAITMKYKTPMAIVINNKYVAESFLTYFRILWDVSSEKI